MNIESRMLQAEMVLNLKRQLFKAKRCTQEELERAEDALVLLQQELEGFEKSSLFVQPVSLTSEIQSKNYDEYQAELSRQAKKLSDEQANVSNQIVAAYLAKATNAGGLMQQAIALRSEVEKIWDKKVYLKRNGCMPAETSSQADTEQVESEESRLKRMSLQQERKLIKDQIGKLDKKIADPTKHVRFHKAEEKVNEWRKQLMIYQEELSEINLKLQL